MPLTNQAIRTIYLHIPFCPSICPFCAFAIHQDKTALHGPYLAALHQEIALRSQGQQGRLAPIDSVYIGGGTPSSLSSAELAALLRQLRSHFPFHPEAEIAFEVNPEHARRAYLAQLITLGVNRISLGLQSPRESTLRALGRRHTAAQGRQAAEALGAPPGLNFNLDLMVGAPGLEPAESVADLEALLRWEPPHLSLYLLDLEKGTLFDRDPKVRSWLGERQEELAEHYAALAARLCSQGYRHYEVSNFCLPGREGRQNLRVWDGEPYLGLGTGAHSFLDGRRWSNHRHIRAYQRDLATHKLPVAFEEKLSPGQMADEALMLALRRAEGLDLPAWEERFQLRWSKRRRGLLEHLVAKDLATWDGTRLALKTRGMMLADAITTELMGAE